MSAPTDQGLIHVDKFIVILIAGVAQIRHWLIVSFYIIQQIQRAVSCAVIATAGPNDVASDIREVCPCT